jgi:cytochrome c556
MRSQQYRFVAQVICGLAAMASLLMQSAALAQQSLPSAPVVKDPKSQTRERQDREATLRSAEVGAALDRAKDRRMQIDIEQIKQDYKRIQILRNEMAHIVLANKPFDYKAISERAEAVGKSADRLKMRLIPKTAEQKQTSQKSLVEFNQGEMKSALVRLCKLIDHFVENPMLKNPDVTNAQQAIEAGNDLLSIIELSSNVRRSAEKLKTSR